MLILMSVEASQLSKPRVLDFGTKHDLFVIMMTWHGIPMLYIEFQNYQCDVMMLFCFF